ncbi:hypothetical protein [Pseudoalteromonas sp. T1lg22]|uniref:hypothetical protein n=1 Tax=Pseudoalteromonas sp. T1lg22 TaxID=2077096 RepID=UPI00131A2851|nr:hypothetical protein [Pseudoalteromonas sp. T1lg22]
MKLLKTSGLFLAAATMTGCVSNAADTATPAPTNLTGMYKASFFGGSVAWKIESDGTGVACEQRNTVGSTPTLRDMVINGTKAYDVFEFTITNVTEDGFTAEGISDMQFKKISKFPVACKV